MTTTYSIGDAPISAGLGRAILAAHTAEFGPWIAAGLVHQHLIARSHVLLHNLYGRDLIARHWFTDARDRAR